MLFTEKLKSFTDNVYLCTPCISVVVRLLKLKTRIYNLNLKWKTK